MLYHFLLCLLVKNYYYGHIPFEEATITLTFDFGHHLIGLILCVDQMSVVQLAID
jgi:hypothetical protein